MRLRGWLLAVSSLLVGGAVWADYLIVRVDLGKVYQSIPNLGTGGGSEGQPLVAPPQPGSPIPAEGALEGPYLSAIIEIKGKMKTEGKKETATAMVFDHPWSKNGPGRFLEMPGITPKIIKYTKVTTDTPAKQFEKTFKKELQASKDPTRYLNAATWALHHGLLREFHATIEELRKLDPKNAVVLEYTRVQSGLKNRPTELDPSLVGFITDLKKKGDHHSVVSDGGHYQAWTNLPGQSLDGAIRRRANRLEEAMEYFYYWFAVHPKLSQPPIPKYQQVLLITKSDGEFLSKHAQWGSPPFVGEAFTPRRDNFIVMSWPRVDETHRFFEKNNHGLLHQSLGFTKDAFVYGTVWDPKYQDKDVVRLAFAQTLTLVQKAIEEESEVVTLSHHGIRQLLFSSGILPRHVHTPEWITEGLASYFESPTGAPYRTVGLPSWSHLVAFKDLRLSRRLEKPVDVLRNVLTDHYFRTAHQSFADLGDSSDREKVSERIRDEMDLATSTAWAFTYYLIERQRTPELLLQYCRELDTLPRDLDLDERALEACFAKVFKLGEAGNPLRLDQAKLAAFADRWFSEMSGVSLEIPEIQNEYLDARKVARKAAAAAAALP